MRQPTRTPVRAGLVYLAAVFLTVGLWATLVPSSFYEEFPGGRHWVAGDGPYNAHVVGDPASASWRWESSPSWPRCGWRPGSF